MSCLANEFFTLCVLYKMSGDLNRLEIGCFTFIML